MVGDTRIELVTPSMSTKCSTAELIAHSAPLHPTPTIKVGEEIRAGWGCYKRSRREDQGLLALSFPALCYYQ